MLKKKRQLCSGLSHSSDSLSISGLLGAGKHFWTPSYYIPGQPQEADCLFATRIQLFMLTTSQVINTQDRTVFFQTDSGSKSKRYSWESYSVW